MKNWIITSAAIAALSLSAVAAQEPPGPGDQQGPDRGGPMEHEGQQSSDMMLRAVIQNPELAEKVGLKDEQVKAIRDAAFAQREQLVNLRGQAELGRLQVEKLLAADPVDEAAVMKAVDAAGQQEIAVKKAEIAFRIKMKSLVGKDVVDKIRTEMRNRMAERRSFQGGQQRSNGQGGGEMRRPRLQQSQGGPSAPPPPPPPETER